CAVMMEFLGLAEGRLTVCDEAGAEQVLRLLELIGRHAIGPDRIQLEPDDAVHAVGADTLIDNAIRDPDARPVPRAGWIEQRSSRNGRFLPSHDGDVQPRALPLSDNHVEDLERGCVGTAVFGHAINPEQRVEIRARVVYLAPDRAFPTCRRVTPRRFRCNVTRHAGEVLIDEAAELAG